LNDALTDALRIVGYDTLAPASASLAGLPNAPRRAANSGISAAVLVVDAKDDSAAAFYRRHGFSSLADSPTLPLASAR
jgi:hypothetical protein